MHVRTVQRAAGILNWQAEWNDSSKTQSCNVSDQYDCRLNGDVIIILFLLQIKVQTCYLGLEYSNIYFLGSRFEHGT